MRKGAGSSVWLRHLAVAAAYAAAFALLREISFSHWLLFSGLRLSALLLVPYRYWPALLVGEMAPLGYTSLVCLPELGWLWSLLILVPPIGLAMPVARFCRERLRLFPVKGEVDMGALLLCTLLVSLIWTAANMVVLMAARLPADYPSLSYPLLAGRWFLGNYLGVLTIVPLVLLVREDLAVTPWRQLWARLPENRLFLESVSLLLPSLALLVWLGLVATADMRQIARMAMFLPVVGLALRHGWRGAAVGGTAASIAVVLTMPAKYDHGTLLGQVFIAFTITTMLLLGARIAALLQRERQERVDARLALALAQRNVHLNELQLQQTSFALEQIRETVQSTYGQMMARLRHSLPSTDERNYHRQAVVAQEQMYRLADSLYPQVWRERGLPGALREGAMARMLGEAGIAYWCDFRGSGLGRLSSTVLIALYRLACEAVAYLCSRRNVSELRVRVRCGVSNGRCWAVLCIDSHANVERLGRIRWEELQPRLSRTTGGMGLEAIRDRAEIFEGKVHARPLRDGQRISILLVDPE